MDKYMKIQFILNNKNLLRRTWITKVDNSQKPNLYILVASLKFLPEL